MNKKLLIIISSGIVVVILAVCILAWNVNQSKHQQSKQFNKGKRLDTNNQQLVGNNSESSDEIYQNENLNYTFSYPSNYLVYKISDGKEVIAGNSDHNVAVKKDEKQSYIFSVSNIGTNKLDVNSIKSQFEGSTSGADLSILPVTIAGQPGYKLEFSKEDPYRVSSFYYVQNPKNNQTLEITVLIDDSVASEIFSSFKFTN